MFKLLTFIALFAGPAYAGHEFADANLANGEHVYAQNCASCHGADLEGQPNWRTADENGILPAPHMMKQVIRGITIAGFCFLTSNMADSA